MSSSTKLNISGLGFKAEAASTGRPGYHPRTMLNIYVYGYLNQVQSSRRLEREAKRNVELMWLTAAFRYVPEDDEYECPAGERLIYRFTRMQIRRSTVEHPFGTLKSWMGSTHFLTKALDRVSTETGLHVLAYNMKRVINLLGAQTVLKAIR